MTKRKVYVLDASALLNYLSHYSPVLEEIYITNSVMNEIRNEVARIRLESYLRRGILKVRDPSRDMIDRVKGEAKKTGDVYKLSDADVEILALALELMEEGKDIVLLTDDYAIMNLAMRLHVKTKSLITRGIKEIREYAFRCPSCGAFFKLGEEPLDKICPRCGERLRLFTRRRRKLL